MNSVPCSGERRRVSGLRNIWKCWIQARVLCELYSDWPSRYVFGSWWAASFGIFGHTVNTFTSFTCQVVELWLNFDFLVQPSDILNYDGEQSSVHSWPDAMCWSTNLIHVCDNTFSIKFTSHENGLVFCLHLQTLRLEYWNNYN